MCHVAITNLVEAAGEPQGAAAGDGGGDKGRPERRRGVVGGPQADDGAADEREPSHVAHQVAGVVVAPAGARQAREEHHACGEVPHFFAGCPP